MIPEIRNLKILNDSQHPNEPNSGRKHHIHAVLEWLCSSYQGLSNKPKNCRNLIIGSEVSFESQNFTVPHHEVRRFVTNFKREYLRNDASELHEILQTCPLGYELLNKLQYVNFGALDAKLLMKVRRQLFSILGLLVSEFVGQIYRAGLNDKVATKQLLG